jgi:creatinine amidohydrolase
VRTVRYNHLLPHEIVEAREACPIAYIGIGGLEWHGEHLTVGLDTVKADALAVRCAERAGGLAFPPLYYGENRESHLMEANHDREGRIAEKMGLPAENFRPGYMWRSPYEADRAYIELLYHIMRQMESLGFKVVVMIAGHYPLLRHVRAAAEWFMLDSRVRVLPVTGFELVKEQIPDAGDHAAKWETSLLMCLAPDCVDMGRLPVDLSEPLIGVGGQDPRTEASLEYGERGVAAVVDAFVARAHAALKEVS